MKPLEIFQAELSYLDNNPILILKLLNENMRIQLSKEMLDRLSHLLTVASLEKGDKNDKA
jgi:hypothetical protein